MLSKTQSLLISLLLIVLIASSFLLSACSQASSTTTLPNPTETLGSIATVETTTLPDSVGTFQLSLDTGNMASSFQSETVAAVSASKNAPYWEILPEYTRVTLQGYPISSHIMQPQIFIYPLEALGMVNEEALQNIALLQSLLQSPEEIATMPFLPLFNARQMMQSHIQYLDFRDGQGLRYLTWFSQGIIPVNNHELIYTYQGLTRDGKYYVSAVLPINHPSLPADGTITGHEPPEFTSDYTAYLMNVVANLNPQASNTFSPNLTQLDAMMSSLEIK